jgi:hypothetical protein
MTSDEDDLTTMTDPDFLAERRRVREALEHTPEQETSSALADRYRRLNGGVLPTGADFLGR